MLLNFPSKKKIESIEDNFELSKNRLKGFYKKFQNNPELFTEYEKVINSQLEEGIIEHIEESVKPPGNMHYYHTELLSKKRSSHREVFCKKGVLFCQEGLSLVLAEIYHQNRSFSQVDKNISPGSIIYIRTGTDFQEEAVLTTVLFSQEGYSIPRTAQIDRKVE